MASLTAPRDLLHLQTLTLARSLQRRDVQSSERRLSLLRRSSRKKARLVLILETLLMQVMTIWMPREVWTLHRSRNWWDQIVQNTFTPRHWIENFRVSRDTFLYICRQLKERISKCNTKFRKAISLQHRIAITLWVLATPSEYRSIAHLFGAQFAALLKRLVDL